MQIYLVGRRRSGVPPLFEQAPPLGGSMTSYRHLLRLGYSGWGVVVMRELLCVQHPFARMLKPCRIAEKSLEDI